MPKQKSINPDCRWTKKRVIAFVVQPPLQDLDLFGPSEVFNTAIFLKRNYEIVLLSTSRNKKIITKIGVPITAHSYFGDYQEPIDTLIVLSAPESAATATPELLAWLQYQAKHTRRICSVCAGAFLLAQAGILNGKKATTHWLFEAMFRKNYPQVKLDIASIWSQDGKVYTSAGVSTGIDLSLALVEEDCGPRLVSKIAKGLILFLRRSGTQKQFSRTLIAQTQEGDHFNELSSWLLENIAQDLSIERIAQFVKMSPRHFSRQFSLAFNQGPGEYVRSIRLDRAKELLENTPLDWKSISSKCGMPGEALRRAFVRETGITPVEYRNRHQSMASI